jgi:hypothetical protein
MSSNSAMRRSGCPGPWCSPCVDRASPSAAPMRILGFRLAYGSWKMICSRLRSRRMRAARQCGDVLAAVQHLAAGAVEQAKERCGRWCSCPIPTRPPGPASRRGGWRTTRRPRRAPAWSRVPKWRRRSRTSISGTSGDPSAGWTMSCMLMRPGLPARARSAPAAAGRCPPAPASRRGSAPGRGRSAARTHSPAAVPAGSTPGRGSRTERQDLRLDGHVERGGRLVGDQQRRVAGQRHGDHHALAHAARQLVRVLAWRGARRRGSPPAPASRAAARAPAARSMRLCRRSASAICSPMVSTGFRLVIGSWKIIATSLPRSARIADASASGS